VEPVRKRLIQLLGMTGSAHDGEALNALRLALRAMAEAGTSWSDLIGTGRWSDDDMARCASEAYQKGFLEARQQGVVLRKTKGGDFTPVNGSAGCATFAEFAEILLDHYDDALSDWERQFCESWLDKRYRPSEKQLAIFRRMAQKTGTEAELPI
jgi:hypothetical protein